MTTPIEYIDSHTHIYSEQFDEDRDKIIDLAIKSGVVKMLMPNCDIASIDAMLATEKTYPDWCVAMMGIHPCYINTDYQSHLKIAERHLQERSFCAIGEIGLDYYWEEKFVREQKKAFLIQLDWANKLNLPIAIHTRNSMEDAIEIVASQQKGNLKGVFHCFGGTVDDAQKIIDLGFHLGIGGILTFKNSNLADVIKTINIEHLLLETDAPYLAPAPFRGKRNHSAYLSLIAQKVAEIKGITIQEVAKATTQNTRKIFGV